MKLTQVLAENDSKQHELNANLSCWCKPEILEESKGRTAVHNSIIPMVQGHKLRIVKFASIDGSEFIPFVDEIHLTQKQIDLYSRFLERKREIVAGEVDA